MFIEHPLYDGIILGLGEQDSEILALMELGTM